ncbi:MAG: hypothetical protein NTW15_15670 [Burkholderiales bacterium]|nr:hypothetical protein [Burkholderiales bacterium]
MIAARGRPAALARAALLAAALCAPPIRALAADPGTSQAQPQTQLPPQATVPACRLPGAEDGVRRTRVPELEIAWRPVAGAIELGRPFSIEFVLCPRLTPAPPIDRITVDAWMPAHRHGMNYRPTLAGTPPAPLRADGLLLHMPGRWEIVFELRAGERALRLTDGLVLR